MTDFARLPKAFLVAFLALPLTLAALTAPAQAAELPTITWPTATRHNPNTSPYAVDVSFAGLGLLYADWQGDRTPLGSGPNQTVAFPNDGVGHVSIILCVLEICTPTGLQSPLLEVYRGLQLDLVDPVGTVAPGQAVPIPVQVTPLPGVDEVNVDWILRDGVSSGDPVLALGAEVLTATAGGVVAPVIDIPSGVDDGVAYSLELSLSADISGFGVLLGTLDPITLLVDRPAEAALSLGDDEIYPASDGYRDTLDWSLQANEDAAFVLEALTPGGAVAESIVTGSLLADQAETGTWDGRDVEGEMVPAGDYVVRATVSDAGGNVTTADRRVTVRDESVRMMTSVVTVRARKTLQRSVVGACSRLKSPSSHRWKGSLGYHSRARCHGTTKRAGVVKGTHAWWLPDAVDDQYGKLKVLAYGGKARGTKRASAVMGYLRADDNALRNRVRASSKVAWRAGRKVSAKPFLRMQDGRRFVSWTVRVANGSHYDVKSFRLRVSYQALVSPSGKAAPQRYPRTAPR